MCGAMGEVTTEMSGRRAARACFASRLRALDIRRGEMAFVHLGQLGFMMRLGRAVAGCDMFLSPMEGRLVPPQTTAEDAASCDLIFGTHDHADHIDRPLWRRMAALGCRSLFVVPAAVRESVIADTGLPARQVVGMDAGETRVLRGVGVKAVASAHERIERDARGRHLALGFVLSAGGVRIYHSGDCCPYEGLQTTLSGAGCIDVAFLPVNGRSAWRLSHGFIGCMDGHEAVELAGELGAGALVPGHHDMFAPNLGDVDECRAFAAVKYPALRVEIPRTGRVCRMAPRFAANGFSRKT